MNRQRAGVIAVTTVVVATFLTSLGFVADGLSEKIQEGTEDRAALRAEVREKDAQLDDQQAKTALAIDQLREAGIKPSVDASIPEPSPAYTPSPAVLMNYARQALADFCSDGRCTPKDGKDGQDGEPGADSTVPGPEGPQGPAGPAGADGADGKDGRGVKSVECTNDGWVVTYTDESTSNAGQCRPNGPLA